MSSLCLLLSVSCHTASKKRSRLWKKSTTKLNMPIYSVSMQKIGLSGDTVWLLYLAGFILTLSSPSKGRGCLCLGLHQCSLAFPAYELGLGVRVTLGPVCLLCIHAGLLRWQHVARGPRIIPLPLLACGHCTSPHNLVKPATKYSANSTTNSLDVVVAQVRSRWENNVLFSHPLFYSVCVFVCVTVKSNLWGTVEIRLSW